VKPIKIWFQDIFPKEIINLDEKTKKSFSKRYKKHLMEIARDGTEIDIHHVKHSSYILDTLYMEMLNDIWIIDGIIEAERKGYDAAIIGCGNDPALYECRQAVDIPVIGLTEATLLLAHSLANKIGLVTVSEGCAAILEDRIHRYRLESKIVYPIQIYKLQDPIVDLFRMITEPESINPHFEDQCKKCISNGAEIIIPACANLSPATTLAHYREVPGTGVPILDITQVGVKAAEMQVDLLRSSGIKKSQKGLYKSIKPQVRDRMQKLAGFSS
jgi:allantoin racemase